MTILFGSIVATLAAHYVLREQARLHSSVKRETSNRIRAESAHVAVSASEARYRGLIESLPAAIVVHRAGHVVYLNPACLADELNLGTAVEYRLQTARDNAIVVEAMSAAITHDGKRAVQTLLRDITERSAAQAALEAARNAAEAASRAKSEFLGRSGTSSGSRTMAGTCSR